MANNQIADSRYMSSMGYYGNEPDTPRKKSRKNETCVTQYVDASCRMCKFV